MSARQGFLVIADIGGYTAFLSGTELEHAQAIIEDLCGVMHAALVPALQFVKLEGDALFCYGDSSRFTDGERLIEIIESCHFAFTQRIAEMRRNTTCQCAACASIHTLELKFVAHYGEFVIQRMAGMEDLAGPDVILVHRLLKNTVTEGTGWSAYALITSVCAEHTGLASGWREHEQYIESFDQVTCWVRDLAPVTAARQASHRIVVEGHEADFSIRARLPAPPAVVWQYWIDADKRVRWQSDIESMHYDKNAEGRMGPGAVGHCDHGSWASDMRFLDWRPFSYYTIERVTTRASLMSAPRLMETMELVPVGDQATELHYRMRAQSRPGRIKMKLAGPMVRRSFERELRLLEQALIEDGVARDAP